MIIQRLFSSKEEKEFARRDYEGLDKKAKEELRSSRNIAAQYLNNTRNSNNYNLPLHKKGLLIRNKLHDLAINRLDTTDIDRERLLRESKKRNLIKKGGKAALITGGVVAAGIGAKKLADKKKAKKESDKKD